MNALYTILAFIIYFGPAVVVVFLDGFKVISRGVAFLLLILCFLWQSFLWIWIDWNKSGGRHKESEKTATQRRR